MPMLNITVRKKARQFGRIVKQSALQPRTGESRRPVLVGSDQLGITFIGHSSFFIQIGGRNIVVDPNFAQWIFLLKRLRRPGVAIRELPPIHCVLVTHAHFDHLHRPSLRTIARLSRKHGDAAPEIVVPRHVSDLVADLGFSRVTELEWWQEHRSGTVSITATPANHWGARMLRDFHRGFCGYVIQTEPGHSVYHAGDTAYFRGFHEIGERLAPQVALLPIGAYSPESFRNVHTSPEDAVQGFLDLNAQRLIPMHYGTFRLSHEPMEEPVPRLLAAASAAGIRDRVLVLEEGRTEIFTERLASAQQG
jgi:L-ascorbate metabolism protein UlaG (beta-lactamase superfamily)